jgi:hypothetical protein
MSQQEIILLRESGVKAHDSDSPPSIGLKAGAFADVGTLMLTNRRLVYITKGGASRAAAWVVGGALLARSMEKSVSQAEIDEVTQFPGSFSIPLQNITAVRVDRKLSAAYLSVQHNTIGIKPVYSFVFGSGWSKNENWVDAINSAKNSLSHAQSPIQNSTPTVQLPPPPSDFHQPSCHSCGEPLTFIQQYQRWYCFKENKYA